MKKITTLAIICLTLLFANSAWTKDDDEDFRISNTVSFDDGAKFLEICSKADPKSRNSTEVAYVIVCENYIYGFVDSGKEALLRKAKNEGAKQEAIDKNPQKYFAYCIPPEVFSKKILDGFVQYLKDNRSERREATAAALYNFLKAEYPCVAKKAE